jgi:hypothetical protein
LMFDAIKDVGDDVSDVDFLFANSLWLEWRFWGLL